MSATWQHKKSGHVVREIGRGRLQTAGTPILQDMDDAVIYEHDGNLWVRAATEFEDGRFAPSEPTSSAQQLTCDCGVICQDHRDGCRYVEQQPAVAMGREACDLCNGIGVDNHHQTWPGSIRCRACKGTGVLSAPEAERLDAATVEACAKIVEGEVYNERYRKWPQWGSGNRENESEIVRFADCLASAIRTLAGSAS